MLKYNQSLLVSKTYDSMEEYVNSPEFAQVFAPYAPSEKARRINLLTRQTFVRGYVVQCDPDQNYGRPFILFREMKGDNGLRSLKEESAISCLSTQDLLLTLVTDNIIFISTKDTFPKNSQGIDAAIKSNSVVF